MVAVLDQLSAGPAKRELTLPLHQLLLKVAELVAEMGLVQMTTEAMVALGVGEEVLRVTPSSEVLALRGKDTAVAKQPQMCMVLAVVAQGVLAQMLQAEAV